MKRESFLEKLSVKCGLYGEVFPGKTLVEIVNADRVLIENHKCVLGYSLCLIRVRCSFGIAEITGQNLVMGSVCCDHITIHGHIQGVRFIREGEDG